jgi:heavy metal translocating P-type ATPase
MTHARARPVCDYCKLPLSAGWWRGPASLREQDHEPALFCCLGCRMAAAILEVNDSGAVPRAMMTRLGLSIFFTMNVMAFTMALWTGDVYGPGAAPGELATSMSGLFRYLVLLFSLPVLALLGVPLFEHALSGLRRGVLSTDVLLASGVAAAFVASFPAVFQGRGPIYFEIGCVILVMTTLGRWLEATSRVKAGAALDGLVKLLPDRVRRIRSGVEELVALDAIESHDRIRVLPGERFPADGHVIGNSGLVDERVLTGESVPVLKQPGDRILGGTLDIDGDLTVEVTHVGEEGALGRVVDLVRRARETSGRYERLADRTAAVFVPAVWAIALTAFGVHWALGSLERGLLAGLAVGLIACPCALGLAAPLAVWSALGQAAAQRVLFRSGEALERLAEVRAVRFDKTGTLTDGAAAVSRFETEDADFDSHILGRAATLADSSSHALARALVSYAQAHHASRPEVITDIRVVPGRGAIGWLLRSGSPMTVVLGSRRFLDEQKLLPGPRLESAALDAESRGLPMTLVGWDGRIRGLFVFEERWRSQAPEVIRRLVGMGLDVSVLTGDHAARGRAIAGALGIAVEAELLPEGKVAAIEAARSSFGPVCMVGDGVNDSPALAASDVGIALGCGTDVSRESASICLMDDDLARIPWCIELARRTRRVIRRNLAWAFGYNSLGVACAALGWLNPALAASLMVASSTLVVVNSLRLGRPFELPPVGRVGSPFAPAPRAAQLQSPARPALAATRPDCGPATLEPVIP